MLVLVLVLVLVLSIAVLVIELVALPQHSRFDHEHEHRFTEHEHVVVFCQLPTNQLPSSLSRRSTQLKATKVVQGFHRTRAQHRFTAH